MADRAAPGPATGYRLLVVHAHPDDEASKGAATSARYVDQGAEVVLVTCTGGEAGEVLNQSFGLLTPDEMPSVRQQELAAAVEVIGFTRNHNLGERDSGWHEDLAAIPGEECFWHAPLSRPAGRLAAILRTERPHVVVTYPPDGGYPHPDHIRTHQVTMAAVDLAADADADLAAADADLDVDGEPWEVPRVVGTTVFTEARVQALHEAMVDAGLESPYEQWLDPDEERPVRDAERLPVAARLDVAAWFPRRDAALRAHASQIDPEGMWFAVPRGLEAEVWPWEEFVCLRPEQLEGAPLDDLFAGL